jgi:hypothetical protein
LDIVDLLLARYGSLNKLSLATVNKLINKAIYEKQEKRVWEFWVSTYPHVKDPVGYEEFKQRVLGAEEEYTLAKEHKSKSEILKDAKSIMAKVQNGDFVKG